MLHVCIVKFDVHFLKNFLELNRTAAFRLQATGRYGQGAVLYMIPSVRSNLKNQFDGTLKD